MAKESFSAMWEYAQKMAKTAMGTNAGNWKNFTEGVTEGHKQTTKLLAHVACLEPNARTVRMLRILMSKGGDPTAGHPSALAYAAGLAHALHVRVLCEGGAKPDKSVMVRCMTWYSASTRLVLPRPKRKSDELESAFLRSLEAHEQKVDALKTKWLKRHTATMLQLVACGADIMAPVRSAARVLHIARYDPDHNTDKTVACECANLAELLEDSAPFRDWVKEFFTTTDINEYHAAFHTTTSASGQTLVFHLADFPKHTSNLFGILEQVEGVKRRRPERGTIGPFLCPVVFKALQPVKNPMPFLKRLCSCAPALLQAEPASGTAPPPAYTTATTELFVPDSVLLEVGEHLVFSAPHPDSEAVLKVRVSANNWTKQAGPFLSERGIKIDVVAVHPAAPSAPLAKGRMMSAGDARVGVGRYREPGVRIRDCDGDEVAPTPPGAKPWTYMPPAAKEVRTTGYHSATEESTAFVQFSRKAVAVRGREPNVTWEVIAKASQYYAETRKKGVTYSDDAREETTTTSATQESKPHFIMYLRRYGEGFCKPFPAAAVAPGGTADAGAVQTTNPLAVTSASTAAQDADEERKAEGTVGTGAGAGAGVGAGAGAGAGADSEPTDIGPRSPVDVSPQCTQWDMNATCNSAGAQDVECVVFSAKLSGGFVHFKCMGRTDAPALLACALASMLVRFKHHRATRFPGLIDDRPESFVYGSCPQLLERSRFGTGPDPYGRFATGKAPMSKTAFHPFKH